MCGIAGFCDFNQNLLLNAEENRMLAARMGKVLTHRGPDDAGVLIDEHIAFAHTRLAVIDPERGRQPMRKHWDGVDYIIVYNGELYNTEELREELKLAGFTFETSADTEVLLTAYIAYGKSCVEKLNGIFSFAIWNNREKSVFLARDRAGVKPFFYMEKDQRFLFGSEIKSLFAYPEIKAVLGRYGLCEIFGLGPARSLGCGVFLGVHEIPPAYCGILDYSGLKLWRYWDMEAKEHKENYEETVDHARELLFDAIRRQLVSDVPICTLLSGGLDSSVVSAVAADYFKKQGKQLDTYSFDYVDNDINFKASKFQPTQDRPFVDKMVEHIHSNHHYLSCNYDELYEKLFSAVRAKDLPGMADVDSSLLFFAEKIKKHHTVCLSGECADEIFGGYPWFRDEEALRMPIFPWSKDLKLRQLVLRPEIAGKLFLEEYVMAQYEKTMQRTKCLFEEKESFGTIGISSKDYWNYLQETEVSKFSQKAERLRRRQISRLNLDWFMETLLERKDRMTMASGLEVRVPFADHRVMEYVYNIPWEYKYKDGRVKGLLLDIAKPVLPREVIERKKCPYPKTYDPKYENLLKKKLSEIIEDKEEPLNALLNGRILKQMIQSPSDYGRPWFGQLMAQPQMFAYFIEINYWLKEYQVEIRI